MVHSCNTMATLFFSLKHCFFWGWWWWRGVTYILVRQTQLILFIEKKSLTGLANFCVSSIFQSDVSGTVAVLVGMSIWEDCTLMLSRDTW